MDKYIIYDMAGFVKGMKNRSARVRKLVGEQKNFAYGIVIRAIL